MTFGVLLRLIRPTQWVKNTFVFAALLFGNRFTEGDAWVAAGLTFLGFCALASSVYVSNDLIDRERDRHHPQKQHRPLAAGVVAPGQAVFLGALLASLGFLLTAWVSQGVFLTALAYVGLNLWYAYVLKHVVLLDVFAVAANYVARVVAGALAIAAPLTPWLLIASTLLALFLALGKRRYELALLGAVASSHRRSLGEYSPELLDQLIGIVTASTVVVYSFYTLSPEVQEKFGTDQLFLTIPFVLYGIFRYLYLLHRRAQGGNPTETLLSDPPLIATVLLWALAVGLILGRS